MTFHAAGRLWLLLIVVALAIAYVLLQWRRRRYTMRFTNVGMIDKLAPRRPAWRRHLAAALLLASVALTITAFARPYDEVEVPRERATIIVAMDVSLSMKAKDVSPTRLKAAQRAANQFIESMPDKFNVGLVAYAGTASVLVPPTTERAALTQAVDGLELDESTATGEAIYTSLDALKQVPPDPDNPGEAAPARVVLMADGAENTGRSSREAAREAKSAGVPVNTIAFGTEHGTVQIEGETQAVGVEVEALQRIANTTNGKSYTAESGEELEEVYSDIGSSIGKATEEQELTSRYVGFALVGLLLAVGLSLFFFARLP